MSRNLFVIVLALAVGFGLTSMPSILAAARNKSPAWRVTAGGAFFPGDFCSRTMGISSPLFLPNVLSDWN